MLSLSRRQVRRLSINDSTFFSAEKCPDPILSKATTTPVDEIDWSFLDTNRLQKDANSKPERFQSDRNHDDLFHQQKDSFTKDKRYDRSGSSAFRTFPNSIAYLLLSSITYLIVR